MLSFNPRPIILELNSLSSYFSSQNDIDKYLYGSMYIYPCGFILFDVLRKVLDNNKYSQTFM